MSLTLKTLDLHPLFLCLKLTFIISCFSYTATIFSLFLFTNFIEICSLAYDIIIGSTIRTVFIDGVSLNLFVHSVIGLIIFLLFSNKNRGRNIIVSSSTFEISLGVEGEFNPSTYSPLVNDIQKTERESLLAKLQKYEDRILKEDILLLEDNYVIWDEIGEPNTDRERSILELEQLECLEAYKRKIDQATKTKEKMRQKIVDVIAQLASLHSTTEDTGIHVDHSSGYPKNLKEYLVMTTASLERATMERRERRPMETPVILNIYDLTTTNRLCYWAGLGAFHSGVEVYGVEYSFGAADSPSCCVFEVEPKKCPNYKFRKSIVVGTTSYDALQLRLFMDVLSCNYNGDSYNLLTKNCNHFSKDVCFKLTGKSIPKWINRLAKLGSHCCCV